MTRIPELVGHLRLRIAHEQKRELEQFAYLRSETVSDITRRAIAAELEALREETPASGNPFIDKSLRLGG